MMDIYYKNSMGDVINLLSSPYMLQTGDIFDYNWNYSNRAVNKRGNKITGFQKEIKEFTLLLSILNSGRLQYYSAVNHFMEITEIDVLNNTPGELHVGEMYLKCYVTSSQKTEWESDIELLDNEITIVTDYPFWCKDKTYSFYTAPESIKEPPRYTHTAYAWSADGTDRFTVTYPKENLLKNTSSEWKDYSRTNWAVYEQHTLEYYGLSIGDKIFCSAELQPISGTKAYTGLVFIFADNGAQYVNGQSIELGNIGVSQFMVTIPDGTVELQIRIVGFIDGTTLKTGKYRKAGLYKSDVPVIYTPAPTEDPGNAYPTYMGIYSSDSPEQPTNPKVYTWSRIRAGETKPTKIDYPRDYPYGFITKYKPATRRVLRDYTFDYYKNHKIGKLDNDHFAETAFKLIVYGPCTHPEIRIGPNLYKVSATLYDSEYMVIDSRERTVTKYGINGVQTNLFNSRDKENYIFQKIPAGKQTVKWNAQYPFDVILYQERSEPAWSM